MALGGGCCGLEECDRALVSALAGAVSPSDTGGWALFDLVRRSAYDRGACWAASGLLPLTVDEVWGGLVGSGLRVSL